MYNYSGLKSRASFLLEKLSFNRKFWEKIPAESGEIIIGLESLMESLMESEDKA